MASEVASGDPDVLACIFFSYPLHPPGQQVEPYWHMDRLPLGPVYKHCRWAVLAGAWPWVVTWGRSGAHRAQALAERSLCSSSKHSPGTKRALVSQAHMHTNTRTVAESALAARRSACGTRRLLSCISRCCLCAARVITFARRRTSRPSARAWPRPAWRWVGRSYACSLTCELTSLRHSALCEACEPKAVSCTLLLQMPCAAPLQLLHGRCALSRIDLSSKVFYYRCGVRAGAHSGRRGPRAQGARRQGRGSRGTRAGARRGGALRT